MEVSSYIYDWPYAIGTFHNTNENMTLIMYLDDLGTMSREELSYWSFLLRPRSNHLDLDTVKRNKNEPKCVVNTATQNYKLYNKTKDPSAKPVSLSLEDAWDIYTRWSYLEIAPHIGEYLKTGKYGPSILRIMEDKDIPLIKEPAVLTCNLAQGMVTLPMIPGYAMYGYKGDDPNQIILQTKTGSLHTLRRNGDYSELKDIEL